MGRSQKSKQRPRQDVRPIGASLPRIEDRRLLTGDGQYADDVDLADSLHLCIVRSPVAHGRIAGIDLARALTVPGVVGALDASSLHELGVGEIPVGAVFPGQRNSSNPVLAREKVRYVGQPVAAVFAETPYAAEDGASLVELRIDPLEAVTDTTSAISGEASLLYDEWGTNIVAEAGIGVGAEDRLFQGAAVRLHRQFRIPRQGGLPLEPRGATATYDARTGQTIAWISTQSAHHVETVIAEVCGWPEADLTVLPADTGGAFGTKEYPLAEEILVCALARSTGRPLKWMQDAREHFLGTVHAREQVWDVELAADGDGRLLAIRGRMLYDVGGHCSANGLGPALQSAGILPGPYDLKAYHLDVVAVVTNKTPSGAFRGFGVPQCVFVMERLMDELALELCLSPTEVRRRNLIPPDAQPYRSAAGHRYDSGEYERALDRALALLEEVKPVAAAQRPTSNRGRIGVGLAMFVMPSGLTSSKQLGAAGSRMGAYASAALRMDPGGHLTLFVGVSSQGQGTSTTLAQIAADRLGVDPKGDVTVVMGGTTMTPYDPAGSLSSRVTTVAGAAVRLAADTLRDKLLRLAGHIVEASEADMDLTRGRALVRGSESSGVSIADIARAAHLGHDLPSGMDPGLETSVTFDPKDAVFGYGVHAAVVEVDVEGTGGVQILRYVAVHDSGTIINPLLATGQVTGAIVQGIGGALLERFVYGPEGDLLTASYMDYLVPTAAEVPTLVEIEFQSTPAPDVPGGMKGVAEAGIVGPGAAVANAVANALGCAVDELPLSPERIRALASESSSGTA